MTSRPPLRLLRAAPSSLNPRIKGAFVILLLFCLAGCGLGAGEDARIEPGFGPADVTALYSYSYELSGNPSSVTEVLVEDKREIWSVLSYLTDQAGKPFTESLDQFSGLEATGLRFELTGQSEPFEITHVWLLGKDNLLIFPDGTAVRTTYGSPLEFSGRANEVTPGTQPGIGG